MVAYYEGYLNDVVENQGKLFDLISFAYPDYDTEDFIIHYMRSNTREVVDESQAYVNTMDYKELLAYFLKTDGYSFKKGNPIQGFVPEWIGEFYAYYQWYYNISSRDLIDKIPVSFLKKAYLGLHDLELELAVKKVAKMEIICFHNSNEINGYLSNWYLSDFVIDGMRFTSVEQYMMYSKAICFKDEDIAKKILETNDVAVIKELGRKVYNYNDETWSKIREEVVFAGVFAKFSQNDDLKEKLLSTGDSTLAECAVKDLIWGIGFSMTDPNRFNKNLWKGKNLLGKVLMQARNKLK